MEDHPDTVVEAVIHRRVSSLAIDRDRDIDDDVLARLAAAAQAAPNHRRTRPLRLAMLRGDARRRLGEAIAEVMAKRGEDTAKVDKARSKYLRAPVVVVAASAAGSTNLETEENRYAVAAGIQNILLLGESLGLRTLWGSPAHGAQRAIGTVCGFDADVQVLGLVYVGWPLGEAPHSERPVARVHWLD